MSSGHVDFLTTVTAQLFSHLETNVQALQE